MADVTTRSDSSLATILLTNHLFEADAKPFATKEFWSLADRVDPGVLLGSATTEIAALAGGDGDRIASLLAGGAQLAFELERMERQGFSLLTPFDPAYPVRLRDRLGSNAPPVLYVVGPADLLQREAIAIVGSRNAGPEGIETAGSAARTVAAAGLVLVSGGAKGVDQRSMAAAYSAGGQVLGLLAESLEKRLKDPDTRRVIGEGMVCLATPYNPAAGFSVAGAMNRNKLVYALARTTLVVATEAGSGGTWSGATEALRRGYGCVSVWRGPGEGAGNEALVRAGGVPVDDLAALLTVRPPMAPGEPAAPQLALDL